MKGFIKTALPVSLTLVLALSLIFTVSSPATKASTGNDINLEFFTADFHHTDGDSVDNIPLPVNGRMTGSRIDNVTDVSGEDVTTPLLTFTKDPSVTVEYWDDRNYRDGSTYIWDLPTIVQGEGLDRSVNLVPPSELTFTPGFTVSRTFSQTVEDILELEINTTPKEDLDELAIVVELPYDANNVTINNATGHGNIDVSGDRKRVNISIPSPDESTPTTYTQYISISVVGGGGEISYKPQTVALAWQLELEPDVQGTSATSIFSGLGNWTWDTFPEPYTWHRQQHTAKAILFPESGELPLVNQVYASYENVQTFSTDQESVPNDLLEGFLGMNTDLHNPDDETDQNITGDTANGGPILDLTTTETVIHVENQEFYVPESSYTWEFNPIQENEGQRGAVQIDPDGSSSFYPGFEASRVVTDGIISPGGGDCIVEINVTADETMERLVINGQTRLSEQIITHVTGFEVSVKENGSIFWLVLPDPDDQIHWGYDDNGFGFEVMNPTLGDEYKLTLTINLEPFDPEIGDIDYAPFIQVRNVVSVETGEAFNGDSHEALTGLGTWNWQASGTYLWDWEIKEVKEVNFQGRPYFHEGPPGEETPPWDNNSFHIETHNWFSHEPEGDLFLNNPVNGSIFWAAVAGNNHENTGRTINDLTIGLDTDVLIDWYHLYLDENSAVPIDGPDPQGPYEFVWTAQNIEPGQDVGFIVFPQTPMPLPFQYEPGFDVVRSVDKTEFSYNEGPQIQTLTVVVIPREGYLQNHNNNNILIQVAVDENQLIPNVGNADVEARIHSISYPSDPVSYIVPNGSPDEKLSGVALDNWEVGKPITTQIEIVVTPNDGVVSGQFIPKVWVFEVVEEITEDVYGSEYAHMFGNPEDPMPQPFDNPGYTPYIDQPQLGTWNWTVGMDGEPPYITWRENVLLKGITFSNEVPVIQDFRVGSMFINFGEGVDQDEITVTEASFNLTGGTPEDPMYDLTQDDVLVIIDGVMINIPAGSFEEIGKSSNHQKYIYDSKSKGSLDTQMIVDFEVGEWSLIVNNVDASMVDNSDGVTVIFSVGGNAAIEVVDMKIGGLSYSAPIVKTEVSGFVNEALDESDNVDWIVKEINEWPDEENENIWHMTEHDVVDLVFTGGMDGICRTESWLTGYYDTSEVETSGLVHFKDVVVNYTGIFEGIIDGVYVQAAMTGRGVAEFSINVDESLPLEERISGYFDGTMKFTWVGDPNEVIGEISFTGIDYQIHEGIPLNYWGEFKSK